MKTMRAARLLSVCFAIATALGVVAACVGDDPTSTTSVPDAGTGGVPDAVAVDASEDVATDAGCGLACDPQNCGRSGHSCFGGACVEGVCQPVELATGLVHPSALVLDNERLFWTNTGGTIDGCNTVADGSVMSVKTDGTDVQTIATGLKCPLAVAVSATHVYWLERGTGTTFQDGAIKRASRTGASPETLVTGIANAVRMEIDDTSIYWTTITGSPAANWGAIMRVPLGGGSPVEVVAVRPRAVSLFLDGAYAYYTEDTSGNVYRVAKSVTDGGTDGGQELLAQNQSYATGVIAAHGSAYWFNTTDNVMKRLVLGQTEITVHAEGVSAGAKGRRLAADDTHVYYTTRYGHPGRVPLDGGALETVAKTNDTNGLALADGVVYLTVQTGNGKVLKVAKP